MKRFQTLSRLFCGLTLLPLSGIAAQARQAPPEDSSPGWAIILTDDYKGKSSPLYNAMQYDAVNWYRLLVTKMKLLPDHIILLAEDKSDPDFAAFLTDKTLPPNIMDGRMPFATSPVWAACEKSKTENRVGKQLDWLISQQPKMLEDMSDARNMLTAQDAIPFKDAPTAHNFRVAREVVCGLANKQQTVIVIVATHAGTNPNVVMTKPVETAPAADNKPSDENCLTPADFTLTGCKAGSRMLVMDSSLRYFDEDIAPAKDGKFGSAIKTAFSGDNSLILLASDGSSISLPMTRKGSTVEKPLITGSAFFSAVTHTMESPDDYNLKKGQEAIETAFEYNLSHLKRYMAVKPTGPLKAALLVSATTNSANVAYWSGPSVAPDIAGSTTTLQPVADSQIKTMPVDKSRPDMEMVLLNGVSVGEFKSGRAETIRRRFLAATHSKLRVSDKSQITVGQQNRETVIMMPKRVTSVVENGQKVNFFVTVDDKFARMMGQSKENLSRTLVHDIRLALESSYQCADRPTPRIVFVQGITAFNNAVNDTDFAQAADSFEKVLKMQPDYAVAYVWLGRSLLASHQTDKAREMFADLKAYREDYPERKFDAETEKDLSDLEKKMNP